MQECDDLNTLDGNTGRDSTLLILNTVIKYNDCRLRHSKLIKALK